MTAKNHTRTILGGVARVGAAAVLATGADHLDEFAANGFSTVPTIGTLFLLNFVAATLVGGALLLPLRRLAKHLADPLRALLALTGRSRRFAWPARTWATGLTETQLTPSPGRL